MGFLFCAMAKQLKPFSSQTSFSVVLWNCLTVKPKLPNVLSDVRDTQIWSVTSYWYECQWWPLSYQVCLLREGGWVPLHCGSCVGFLSPPPPLHTFGFCSFTGYAILFTLRVHPVYTPERGGVTFPICWEKRATCEWSSFSTCPSVIALFGLRTIFICLAKTRFTFRLRRKWVWSRYVSAGLILVRRFFMFGK